MTWNRIGTMFRGVSGYRFRAVCDGAHASCGHYHKTYEAAFKCVRAMQATGKYGSYTINVACYEKA